MSIKTRDELLDQFREYIGEDTGDKALSLTEDLSDTMTDYETRLSNSGDWERKYTENDAMWREKYRNRFFSAEDETPASTGEHKEKVTYEELFTSEGGK